MASSSSSNVRFTTPHIEPMDSIFIEKLSLRGKHGVGAEERNTEQEFLIDIRAEFDMRPAATSDKLGDTVDYSAFRTVATEVVSNNSFYLIERMAALIAERILEDGRITKVVVTVRKPSVYENSVPGVTVERTR